ncbi:MULTISPECIES: PucR family transcriptional regulator [Bifidobacterium]|uniref:PucR family transcriptional regulator n=1 Tax=Bifidobacterium TaxID=1678 RepID=UPI0018DD7F9B|nr:MULTISPECIES: helix-turn-helix domain-containing protein [Bifidobacterium]MBI0145913.1 helix-turn-helix domain-containing protein [Bifidobacterium polysaccharolyticum]MBI0152619.1 helix-turn-helix domain-containing protein [Bifidobacterium sp. M0399]
MIGKSKRSRPKDDEPAEAQQAHRSSTASDAAMEQILLKTLDHLQEALPWARSVPADGRRTLEGAIQTALNDLLSRLDSQGTEDSEVPSPVPAELSRSLGPHRAMELTQVILDMLEEAGRTMGAEGERATLVYTRQAATAAAELYADLAETRSGRKAVTESRIIRHLIEKTADTRTVDDLARLGWPTEFDCFAVVGEAQGNDDGQGMENARQPIHTTVVRQGGRALVGESEGLMVVLINPDRSGTPADFCASILRFFTDESAVCLGPLRHGISGAEDSIRAALSTHAAAPAVADPITAALPRPLHADDLLPERALNGDTDAADQLYQEIYMSLAGQDPDGPLPTTLLTFLRSGNSLEVTAKKLGIHPNTVRYRLRRCVEVTGWDAMDPRESFVLRAALIIGRIRRSHPGAD